MNKKACFFCITFYVIFIVLILILCLSDKRYRHKTVLSNSRKPKPPVLKPTQPILEVHLDPSICSQKDRMSHFEKVCKSVTNITLSSKYVVSPEYHITYCAVPKAGSSTWKKLLAVSTKLGQNQTKDINVHNVPELNDRGLIVTNYTVERYKKNVQFFTMRHPLTRLLSAFRDKVKRRLGPKDHHLEELMKERYSIYNTVHKTELKWNGKDHFEVSFRDFIAFVSQGEGVPSVLNDRHWRPQSTFCNPCVQK